MELIIYYEERAKTVRALALTMKNSEMRGTLMMLAAQWDALAAQRTRISSEGTVTAPHV